MAIRKRKKQGDPELNILPFLNVMVVLIAFLLLNAVFAAVAVLNVNLPAKAATTSSTQPDKPKIALEVMIYKDHMLVDDRNRGPLKKLPNIDGKPDFTGLHDYLLKVKEKFPDAKSISLLCENNTPYQRLITLMDTVRYQAGKVAGHDIRKPLFPDISIGSAPPLTSDSTQTSDGGQS